MRLWLARICAMAIGGLLAALSALFAVIQNP